MDRRVRYAGTGVVCFHAGCRHGFFLGSSMAITVGVLLGLFWSAIYNFFASTIGAVLAFSVARYLVSDWVNMHLIVEGRSGGRLGKKYQGG